MNKNGISLIVLVITIIVMIIIAGTIIFSLSNGNVISKAKEAKFKSNLKSIQEELGVYIASNIQTDGSYIYPTKSDIKSADKYGADVINFSRDKVIYKTSDSSEKIWAEELGITVDYTEGLVANYKMNGNTLDSSGTNNGTTYGNINMGTDRLGKSNSTYNFDGLDDYIQIEHNSLLVPDNMTIAIWINSNEWNSSIATALMCKRTSVVTGWTIFYIGTGTSGTINWDLNNDVLQDRWNTGYNPPLETWTHMVFTNDSTGKKLYVNGLLQSQTSIVGLKSSANIPLRIGINESGGYAYNGKMDDVRIYNRALSDSEVKSLYNVYWAD